MYPRTNFEMTEADLQTILDSCKPVAYIMVGGSAPSSPQENANRAWGDLGERMGFDYDTVQPIQGKGNCFFSAVPSENDTQRAERVEREEKEKVRKEIERVEEEIAVLQKHLAYLHPCKGIDLGDGNFSGCSGKGGDCPVCGN